MSVWCCGVSSPLFTSVVSRQDAAAQEVTTFSRGLSTEGEPGSSCVCKANKQQKNTEAEQLQADSQPPPQVHGLPGPADTFASKNGSKFGQAAPAKVALAAESESELRRAGDVPFV